ncbi:MAG: ABC transporter ATP-binding protein [Dehalococcoidales bacterium]|nr:ABC transporter ATP-binding protein [Dehalococcoidales bacterium]
MIIETNNLTRKFGDRLAVDNLNLTAEEGKILGFLGPNGAGKTTTMRMLAGLISPTSGYAVVDGIRPDKEAERVHEIIGILTETPGFYNNLSAQRNLEYFAGFYNLSDASAQIEKYLKLMELWERKSDKVGTFSKGMKQRLAITRALIHRPKILFLDEPTSGLDPEVSQEVRGLIQNLSREGYTIILSTHNLSEAEQLCHRIAVIRSALVTLDTPANLRKRLFKHQTMIKLEEIDENLIQAISKLDYVNKHSREENTLLIELADPSKHQSDLIKKIVEAGGRIIEVTDKKHSLEDIYLSLLNEEEKI